MVAQTNKTRLAKLYQDEIAPKVLKQFNLKSVHQLPRIIKIVVNSGIGRFLENQKLKPEVRDTVISSLSIITGQKPVVVKARKSVSNFKLREGQSRLPG